MKALNFYASQSTKRFDDMAMHVNDAINAAGYENNALGVLARNWCIRIYNALAWEDAKTTPDYIAWVNKTGLR